MGPKHRRNIPAHFILTIWMGAMMSFPTHNIALFKLILLTAALFAVIVAVLSREAVRQRCLTLWDEATAFLGLFALIGLLL